VNNHTEAAVFDLKAHLVARGQLSKISFAHLFPPLGSVGGNWQLAISRHRESAEPDERFSVGGMW
jgi:hypothetical protein